MISMLPLLIAIGADRPRDNVLKEPPELSRPLDQPPHHHTGLYRPQPVQRIDPYYARPCPKCGAAVGQPCDRRKVPLSRRHRVHGGRNP